MGAILLGSSGTLIVGVSGTVEISTEVPTILSGVSDHGELVGLSDDDHTQYLTTARGNVLYYTQAALNAGQLDTRYYTETEVDNRISGVPINNEITTWVNATTIKGEPNLTFDGAIFWNKASLYKQSSTEAGKTDWRLLINTADADLARIYNIDEGLVAYKNMVLGNHVDFLKLDLINTRVGINEATPSYTLDVNGTGRVRGDMSVEGDLGVGTTAPTSTLQVVGLPIYANNAAAVGGGLTAGAFYRTGADPDPVCVVH